MARIRNQKNVARRIDLSYFKRPHPLRTGRKVLTFAVAALTIVLVTFLSLGGDARLHNPGALTAAHAAFQHDCRACHDGGGAGTQGPTAFSKTVSDAACLACHDGSVHHHNQRDEDVTKWPALAKATAGGHSGGAGGATPKDDVHAKLTSKDCVSCHVEHRGHDLLVNSDSRLCVSCHTDVKATTKTAPAIANKVTAFTVADHPRFGRSITKDGKWFDPAVLKFNHAVHDKQAVLKGNCIACHATTDPQVATNEPSPSLPPPYRTDKDRPIEWMQGESRANVQAISFERHCVGCHAIEIPGKVKVTVPHEELSTVRAFLAGVGNSYAARLATMTPAEKEKELVTEVRTGRPPRVTVTKKVLSEPEWVEARLKELGETMDKAFGSGNPKYTSLKRAVVSPSTQPAGIGNAAVAMGPDVNLMEYYVTYGMGANCNYCHEVKGDVPAIALRPAPTIPAPPAPATTTAATTTAASPVAAAPVPAFTPTPLAFTVPTGIPDAPRKWFVNSNFDHYAHRSVTCLDCHSKAVTSVATSDVLSPDLDQGAASCISCHKPDTTSLSLGTVRGAPMNCTTCHGFHNELLERPPTGTLDVRLGKPASRPAVLSGTLPAGHPPVLGAAASR